MSEYVCLIIENDPLELEFLQTVAAPFFDGMGKLLTCRNGAEAADMARKHLPDLILMDIVLPGAEGIEVLEEIRRILPACCISIITDKAEFQCAQRAIFSRVFAYLLKPVHSKDICLLIEHMCREKDEAGLREGGGKMLQEAPDATVYTDQMKEAIIYIKERFCEKITLEEVASKVYMNPQYFSRTFKQQTGSTFSHYVTNMRIQHACRLLEQTDYPVYRIAIECGFSDPSYFNRVFGSSMEMTPQVYRKKKRKL
ncbi:MAG: response regulator transcription factor [Firmicutes bacterium]|nr:response regulator transcription factor [Bacillota bacterium]